MVMGHGVASGLEFGNRTCTHDIPYFQQSSKQNETECQYVLFSDDIDDLL